MEYRYLFQFIIACLFLNIVALPICYALLGKMKDGGLFVGKSIGLYVCGYTMWLLSSLHICKFNTLGIIASVLIVILLGYGGIFYQLFRKKYYGFIDYLKSNYRAFICSELIFILLFIVLNWIFAHRIPGSDTERMMDLGFMSSMYITEYMPPMDMWASGEYINYYYFGQYIITYLTKISCIPVGYGYTFGLYFIISWGCVAVFRLVETITGKWLAGLLSTGGVFFAGNVHYIVFGKIAPVLWDILRIEGEKPTYWFANSTRYIGYVPDVEKDKTIHEFPSYSFIVGDLHAHVINLLVVIVILTLLWCYLRSIKENFNESTGFIKACMNRYTFGIAFLLGICSMSNYWDLPIYYVVSGSIILFGMIYVLGLKRQIPVYVGLSGIFIYMINLIVALPFNLKFEKMVEGIGIVDKRTMLYQYLLLWGFPVILSCIFIAIVIKNKKTDINILYIIMLVLCATGLTVIPELVFVKDIYIDGFPRANTMFKLSYEAFVMFGISIGCIIFWIYDLGKQQAGFSAYHYKKIAVIATVILLWTCCYSITALKMWISDYSTDNFLGFDASYTIRNNNSEEIEAIEALINYAQNNGIKQPVVLEADGDSYTNSCKVSVLTGYPTVLGWHTHEWLWHNSYTYMENRRADVEALYTGEDMQVKKLLVQKYGIDYIYIGLKEYEKYEIVQNYLLEELGEVIYCEACDSGQIIEIIKVDK